MIVAVFELEARAVDTGEPRTRHGAPMASTAAAEALGRAVEAFRASLRADGFHGISMGYGVRAEDVDA